MLQFYDMMTSRQMKNYPMRLILLFCLPFYCLLASSEERSGTDLRVLASVHPLALVAASVVAAEQLDTLVPMNITPHDFAFRPSDIRRIQQADIIFWSGEESEPYLKKFAKRWPQKTWIDVSQGQSKDGLHDTHWWLSAELMIRAQARLADALGESSDDFAQQIQSVISDAEVHLAPLKQQGFFVFHQAYDHWVQERGLSQVGSFTLSPEQKPGLRTLNKMRDQLAAGDIHCVFTEPQFSPAIVRSVTRDLEINLGELDPLGSHISVTKQGYADFLNDLTQRFVECLKTDA